jgi:hypothetical protein
VPEQLDGNPKMTTAPPSSRSALRDLKAALLRSEGRAGGGTSSIDSSSSSGAGAGAGGGRTHALFKQTAGMLSSAMKFGKHGT